MPSFDVRVQLQRPVSGDDARLIARMAAAGFAATVSSSKGVAYRLPPGQFVFNGESGVPDVMKLARGAADRLQKAYAITVSEVVARAWDNLEAEISPLHPRPRSAPVR